jgi:hypothetical protein
MNLRHCWFLKRQCREEIGCGKAYRCDSKWKKTWVTEGIILKIRILRKCNWWMVSHRLFYIECWKAFVDSHITRCDCLILREKIEFCIWAGLFKYISVSQTGCDRRGSFFKNVLATIENASRLVISLNALGCRLRFGSAFLLIIWQFERFWWENLFLKLKASIIDSVWIRYWIRNVIDDISSITLPSLVFKCYYISDKPAIMPARFLSVGLRSPT